MLVSIIILTKNEVQNIGRCLGGVFKQQHSFDLEVIVIDSSSTDGTLDVVNRYPVRIVEIKPDEFHHAGTRNLGAALAKGEILVYLAGDAYPADSSWLSSLISNFSDEMVAAVYGRQIPPSDINPVNRFRVSWHYNDRRKIQSKESMLIYGIPKVYYFSDVNSAVRKCIWRRFKFPEEVLFYEDVGLVTKIIDNGYKVIYEPLSRVYHAHNHSVVQIFQRYFDTARNYKTLGFFKNSKAGKINSEGIQFLFSGIMSLIHNGKIVWIPYFIVFTGFGFLGLKLGIYAEKIPDPIRRLCSEHGM